MRILITVVIRLVSYEPTQQLIPRIFFAPVFCSQADTSLQYNLLGDHRLLTCIPAARCSSPTSKTWVITPRHHGLPPQGTVFGKISAETPGHTTEPQAGYEIRTYSPQIRAEFLFQTASAEDGISSGLNTPFRALAGYIFGGNEKGGGSESITMTSPVVVQKSGSGSGGDSPSGKGGSEKIAMTVPVVMQREEEGACKERKMSFILPSKYTR